MSNREKAVAIWTAKRAALTLTSVAFGAFVSLWLGLGMLAAIYAGNRLNKARRRRNLPRNIERLERELGIIPTPKKKRKKLSEDDQWRRERRCFWSWPLGHDWRKPKSGSKWWPHDHCSQCGAIFIHVSN